MNLSNREDGSVAHMPLTAVLGEIYTRRQTGTLKVFDGGMQFPVFVFWFKKGLPCFSYSPDENTRLGEFLEKPLKKAAKKAARRQKKDADSARRLLGQVMLGLGTITSVQLEQALTRQILSRLQAVCTIGQPSFLFVEGPSEFAVVPVSSPLVNPLETAAMAARQSDPDALLNYAQWASQAPGVRLALNRRMPPALRKHLCDEMLTALVEPHETKTLVSDPERLPTLVFLMAFGYVEFIAPAPEVEPPTPCRAEQQRRTRDVPAVRPVEVLAHLVSLARAAATHYEILGISLDAPAHLVKQRYRELAFQIHPDRVPGDSAHLSREIFAHIVDAYYHLSKERLRVQYDLKLALNHGWSALGTVKTVCSALAVRRDYLTRIGLSHLAQEYVRMIDLVSYQPWGSGPVLDDTAPDVRDAMPRS